MDYRILGPLELRAGDRTVSLRGVRQRELLAVLLLHANEIVSSDRLIDELWERDPPPTAAKIIQNSVSQLRKLIDPELLITRSPGYLLVVGPDELDAGRFERIVEQARADLAEGQPAKTAEALREALGLWRGPALADCADVPSARAEAARLEELRSAATEDRIEAELQLGRHADLVAELEALVAQHPLRERLRAQLMVALYRSGRQAEALRVYHETREVLVEELGLEPGRALQRLERAVLVHDPALELSGDGRPEAPRPVDSAQAPGTRKTVSVVAADVLSLGGPHDPEALRRPMSRAVETVTGVLERHGARTESSPAGGVIGIFGVPTVHEDDALRAVRAATEARTALEELGAELERDWHIAVSLRSGVNTGEVVAGDATVQTLIAGDTVNVAARLQQAADPGEILLDEQTQRLVRDAVRAERVDPSALKATGRESAWRLLELAPGTPGYVRRLETPLIGRAGELAQFRQAFDRAAQQRAVQLFTVLGPAGIGKSRLARELVLSVGDGATLLQGHCPSYGEGITFWPLREIVEQVGDVTALLAGEPEADAIVERLLGAVGPSGQASSNEETFWAARKLFEARARAGRPLIVLLEDAHWAEPTLLDLVEHVAEWSGDAPILLVCLARTELIEARPRLAGGRANISSIVLEPLSKQESDELIEALRGEIELTDDTRARIAAASEGNPLFIEQMLAMVTEQGSDGGRDVPIPPTIRALLAARLEGLDPGERSLLLRASVMGREFRRAALAELSPEDGRALSDALEGLVRRELIRPVRDEVFRFRHLLLLEVAYDALPKLERAVLHERLGSWFEQNEGEEEIVGYHLERAHSYRAELGPVDAEGRALARRAATRLGSAGRRAYERGDLAAAVGLLSRAATLLEPGAAGRVELLADLGEALRETGEFERAEAVLEEVIQSASASGDDVLEARAEVIRLRLRLLTDPEVTEEVVRRAEPLIETFEQAGDDRLLAKAWELLAWAPWFRCQASATVEALERALEHARRSGDARTEAQSLNLSVGAAFFGPKPVPEAIRLCEEILADPTQQQRIRASALRALAGLKAMAGEFDEARELVDAHKELVQELGLRVTAAAAAETYGIIEMLAGDPVAAERELAWGYGLLEEIGETQNFPDLAAKLADALYVQGLDDRALELSRVSERCDGAGRSFSRRAVAGSPARSCWPGKATWSRPRCWPEKRWRSRTRRTSRCCAADALMDLAEVLRIAGRDAESGPFVEQALELYEQKGNVVAAAKARRILDA